MSEFQTRFLTEDEFPLWDQLVEESENGTLFHTVTWNRQACSLDPGITLKVIGCFKGNEIVGGTIAGCRRRMGFQVMVTPYASPFYGVLIKERDTQFISKALSYRKEVLESLLSFIESEIHIGSYAFPPGFIDIREFIWRGYRPEVIFTYRVKLNDSTRLFEGFLPSLKRQIRKGEKLDYELIEGEGDTQLSEVHDLILTSYKRQGHSFRFSRDRFISFVLEPGLKDHLRTYLIRHEGLPVSGLVLLIDGQTAYYWLAGGDHQYFNTGLNQVLLWKVLQQIQEEGISRFDFMGANTPSISNYKSGFNFPLVPYYRVSYESSRLAGGLITMKRFLKG